MIKEIIFDFDGTIADSFGLMMSLFAEYKEEFGFEEFGDEEVKIYREEGVMSLIKKRKIPIWKVMKIIRVGKALVNQKIGTIKPFDGIKDILVELKKRKLILGIMSTNSEENIREFLKENNIDIFDYVVGKGSLFGKTRVIKSILKKRKLNKNEVLYVGDETRDIEACRKLEIKIVSVSWGFSEEKLLVKNKPDYLVESPKDILRIV